MIDREKFEEHWAKETGTLFVTATVMTLLKKKAWKSWQAALATTPQPGEGLVLDLREVGRTNAGDEYVDIFAYLEDDLLAAIHDQLPGVKVKT